MDVEDAGDVEDIKVKPGLQLVATIAKEKAIRKETYLVTQIRFCELVQPHQGNLNSVSFQFRGMPADFEILHPPGSVI